MLQAVQGRGSAGVRQGTCARPAGAGPVAGFDGMALLLPLGAPYGVALARHGAGGGSCAWCQSRPCAQAGGERVWGAGASLVRRDEMPQLVLRVTDNFLGGCPCHRQRVCPDGKLLDFCHAGTPSRERHLGRGSPATASIFQAGGTHQGATQDEAPKAPQLRGLRPWAGCLDRSASSPPHPYAQGEFQPWALSI